MSISTCLTPANSTRPSPTQNTAFLMERTQFRTHPLRVNRLTSRQIWPPRATFGHICAPFDTICTLLGHHVTPSQIPRALARERGGGEGASRAGRTEGRGHARTSERRASLTRPCTL